MTYIEFYDDTVAENICAALTNPPERIILIGHKMKKLSAHANRYARIFDARGHHVEFICRSINRNQLGNIVEQLSLIVEKYDDCVFDLTGGDDLYLVAMGQVCERYKDKHIQIHRFNILNNTIIDCDQDGNTICEDDMPELTVEENISVYGGTVVCDEEREDSTVRWHIDSEFKSDVSSMWDICKCNARLWNTQIGVLKTAEEVGEVSEDGLAVTASVQAVTEHLRHINAKYVYTKRIIHGLYKAGLITKFEWDDSTIRISYKNDTVKKCLTKAGLVLELKVYLTTLDVHDSEGALVYNDVMHGVTIDWDGDIRDGEEEYVTENEIDVIMMHKMVPVFVSCKNGAVEINELYKLNSVAMKFGGKYAKKVVVASALNPNSEYGKYFIQRADDMGICVINDICNMNDDEFKRTLKGLYGGA